MLASVTQGAPGTTRSTRPSRRSKKLDPTTFRAVNRFRPRRKQSGGAGSVHSLSLGNDPEASRALSYQKRCHWVSLSKLLQVKAFSHASHSPRVAMYGNPVNSLYGSVGRLSKKRSSCPAPAGDQLERAGLVFLKSSTLISCFFNSS